MFFDSFFGIFGTSGLRLGSLTDPSIFWEPSIEGYNGLFDILRTVGQGSIYQTLTHGFF
jgi:hypothetical protein